MLRFQMLVARLQFMNLGLGHPRWRFLPWLRHITGKATICFAGFLLLLHNAIAAGTKHEEAERPLWEAAMNRLKENGGYVAACIETDMKVFGSDGRLLGSVLETERLERAEQKLRWVKTSNKKTGSPGMAVAADLGLQSDPASSLMGYDRWQCKGEEQIDGTSVEIWEGITKADPQNSILAYIERESAFLLRAEFTMPFRLPFGSVLIRGEMLCRRSSTGVWLPAQVTLEQTGRLLFMKRRVQITKNYREWEPRSSSYLSAIPRAKSQK